MNLNQIVEEYKKEHVLNLYLQHPDEITRDYTKENDMRDDYEGREVLELLQNAVDEVEIDGKIHIGLKGDILTVANTGVPFDFDGVKSLMKSNLSPKRLKKNTIGQKGLGFRSLLNWSNSISVYSSDLSIRFSETFRKSYFECANINEPTALLVAPEVIKNIDKEGFDTVIIVKLLSDDKINEVKRQLHAIDKYTLLFLNKVNELTVRIENKVIQFKRESNDNLIFISENDEQFTFNTFSKKGVINSKNYEIVIAYDEFITQKDNKLYSFFETNINFPIKWKCHVTFDLETNRNSIKKNDDNMFLLNELANFICEKAEELKGNDGYPYEVFDSLLKTNDFPNGLTIKGVDFNDTFQEALINAEVLPTYSGEKIALVHNPIFYESVPFFFKDIKNDKILIESNDSDRNEVLYDFCSRFKEASLIEVINKNSTDWDIPQCVSVFLWWEREFYQAENLPKLIKAVDGQYIDADTIVYFVRGRKLNIPSWSKIYQMDSSYEQILKNQIMEIDSIREELENEQIIERIIARNSGRNRFSNERKIIPHIVFRDADASTILSPVNSSVEDNYKNAKLFLRWLWENYSNNKNWTAPIEVTFNLPSNENTVEKATKLYFNDRYDSSLAEKIFIDENNKPFINIEEVNIAQDDIFEFKEFVSKLGVLDFPLFVEKEILDSDFIDSFDKDFLTSKLPRNEINPRDPYLRNVYFNVIKDLDKILANLTIPEIFQWVSSDSKLYDELNLKHPGKITFNYTAKVQAYRYASFNDYSKSYIKHVFHNSKWLQIDGKKFSPNQCVFEYNGLDIYDLVPTINNDFIKNLSRMMNITQKEVRDFLVEIGVNNSVTGLKSNDFYQLMLKLPTYDESGQISEKIYREVIENDTNLSFNSLNYRKFIEEGYVFTKNHDGKKYNLASDSYFSSSIQVNVGNYHIMCTPLRNGSFEVFNRVFGVRKFEEKYQVVRDSITYHTQDKAFQQYFKEFVTYARAWTERNDNIKRRLENIRVRIASKVILLDNDESQSVKNDYMLINNKNSWIIYVNKENDLDYRQISKCIEELFAQVANTTNSDIPNQLGELFRDQEGREFLVEKHFGTIDVINQVFQNQIRVSLASSLDLKYESFVLDDIDFNQFSSISNSSKLITLLSNHKKDLSDIKKSGFAYTESIDLRQYYFSVIKNYISLNEEKYMSSLFFQYESRDISEKKKFYEEYLKFKSFNLRVENISNSIYFDYKKEVLARFPILGIDSDYIDVNSTYNTNFNMILANHDYEKFADFLDENIEFKSLVYFLDHKIKTMVTDAYIKTIEMPDFIESDQSSVLDTKSDKVVVTRSIIIPSTLRNGERREISFKPNTKSTIDKRNMVKQKNGKDAERLVRDKLKPDFPSLKWTSENSEIPSERNTSKLYDMEYLKNEKKYFIEVKSALYTFIMSRQEYIFAKSNSENYELYLVDLKKKKIDGPHSLKEFESSKIATEFQFFFKKLKT